MPIERLRTSPSLVGLLLIWALTGYMVMRPHSGTLFTWDSFGYHLYLPAACIHHDPLLKDLGWVDQARKDHDASGTLYQISTLDNGAHVDKYPMGLAVLWSPWFVAGHWIAGITGQPQDGYSPPYDLAVRIGVWVYLLLGLLALRAVLRSRFSEWVVVYTLLLLFAATNLIDQATVGTAMPHITLFCLYAGILWATLRWTAERRPGRALVLAVLMGLAMLVRPSEGVCVLLPFLWRGGNELPNPFKRAW
ncbi:MAG: glycosyltransferase family 39 protein, partial [Bacteroidetes bacterium]|nr:glycosyltransferase family 39 protein [Bacteroidota bacterium]